MNGSQRRVCWGFININGMVRSASGAVQGGARNNDTLAHEPNESGAGLADALPAVPE
jgi:hypothetical protein